MRFLVYMYYTHPGYQTSICGKNRAYYIRIFTVLCLLSMCSYSRVTCVTFDVTCSRGMTFQYHMQNALHVLAVVY